MTEHIPDGEPMIHGRDCTMGDRYPADFAEWLRNQLDWPNPYAALGKPATSTPPYREYFVTEGDRVAYEDTNGDIIIGTVASIEPGPDGSETITLDDQLEHPRRQSIHDVFQEAIEDADLTWTYQSWMPGDPIPYDEMRRILGLPDVRDEVRRMRARLTLERAARVAREALNTMNELATAVRRTEAELRAALPRPHTPPMWADNPARTRRTAYKPTRRVK